VTRRSIEPVGDSAELPQADRLNASPFPDPPTDRDLEALLDEHASFGSVPLCPAVSAFSARSLVEIWEAAERLADARLPSPFWAYPWPAGIGLARSILDRPALVAGRSVTDVGAGGGVASFACARAGARRIVACDIDPWALAVTRIGAARQHLAVETLQADVTESPETLDEFDVVLCGDLAYDRSTALRERAALQRAADRGALVLVADAGRTWFQPTGMRLHQEWSVPVAADVEGTAQRTVRVFDFLNANAAVPS
jgi:predicted nicotinamide N-methyase